jgi:hypothetical protein
MKHILLFCLLLWCAVLELRSQAYDSAQFKICSNLFESKQFEAAYDCFTQYGDNIYAIHHAALISLFLGNEKNFTRLSEKLLSKEYSSPTSYLLYANLYSSDSARYLTILNKGLKVYRHDTLLLIEKTNYFISHKKYKKALPVLDELIQYQKTNKQSSYFVRGVVFEKLQEPDLAAIEYQKAIDFDSTYFDPYFNIAVMYYNRAVVLYTIANKQKTTEDYNKISIQGDGLLRKAIPYFIQANHLQPDNLTVLTTLMNIYQRLKMKKELQETILLIQDIKAK